MALSQYIFPTVSIWLDVLPYGIIHSLHGLLTFIQLGLIRSMLSCIILTALWGRKIWVCFWLTDECGEVASCRHQQGPPESSWVLPDVLSVCQRYGHPRCQPTVCHHTERSYRNLPSGSPFESEPTGNNSVLIACIIYDSNSQPSLWCPTVWTLSMTVLCTVVIIVVKLLPCMISNISLLHVSITIT